MYAYKYITYLHAYMLQCPCIWTCFSGIIIISSWEGVDYHGADVFCEDLRSERWRYKGAPLHLFRGKLTKRKEVWSPMIMRQ